MAFQPLRSVRQSCVCGAPREDIANRIVQLGSSHDFVTPAYFYRCAACRTLSAVNLAFNPDSYALPIENYSIPLNKWLLNRSRVEWIRDRVGTNFPAFPVVYDLGSGEGAFTASFLEYFPQARVVAVERDERFRHRFLQEYQGAEFVPELIEPFLAKAAQAPEADLINLTDVLEHVLEPERILHMIANALKPAGHAYITAPNAASYRDAPRHVGQSEIDWDVANFTCQHLWMMTPYILNRLVNAAFDIRESSRSFEWKIRRDADYSTFLVQRPE
jgi:SAM-dependent methyltransferase